MQKNKLKRLKAQNAIRHERLVLKEMLIKQGKWLAKSSVVNAEMREIRKEQYDLDIHTCHNECPCHTGGTPLSDFGGGY